MSRSPLDVVEVNAYGVPNESTVTDFNFEDWTSFSLKNSITEPAEASFELGDDSGWDRISQLCGLGAQFMVRVDDRPRMVGRVEAISGPSDARQGMTQSFVIRTKLSDALYASAPHGLQLKRASVKAFVLACYEAIGLTEKDFDFRGDVSRDLMTGKGSRSPKQAIVLEPLTEEQAKVNPPETVYAAVDRHLRRHGLLHWDGPDGRIVVAAPDDQQEPLAKFRCTRGTGRQYNNILSVERTQDVSQSPTELGVFGVGGSKDFSKSKVIKLLHNEDLKRRGFRRTVIIIDEGLKTKKLAASRANREFSTRNRSLDRITIKVDGLSYREFSELLPWSPDTTHDLMFEQLGGALGTYYLEDVRMLRNASDGDTTELGLVKQGVWVL
jgi:prophage tail gpP-like protein